MLKGSIFFSVGPPVHTVFALYDQKKNLTFACYDFEGKVSLCFPSVIPYMWWRKEEEIQNIQGNRQADKTLLSNSCFPPDTALLTF